MFHKPIGTCYLQAWKVTTLSDGEYISGPKYCDCYEENKKHIGFSFDLTITPTLEDCRYNILHHPFTKQTSKKVFPNQNPMSR